MNTSRRPIVLLEPVGESVLRPRGQAPRLSTLEDKVIGFLDEGDMSPYLEIFRAILSDLARPAEIPYWHKPLMSKPSPSALLEEVAERCDTVIVGYAHWGGCTSGCTHDAVTLERRGIPTVTLCQDAFEREARFMARLMGIEEIPLVVVRRPRPGELQDMDRDPEALVRGFVNALTSPARVAAKPGVPGSRAAGGEGQRRNRWPFA